MEDEGKFQLVCWHNSHADTGAELDYMLFELSGEHIPLQALMPLLDNELKEGVLLQSHFESWCNAYNERKCETVYRLSCSWTFERGDADCGLPGGYALYIDDMTEDYEW